MRNRGLTASLVVVALLVGASVAGFLTTTRPLLGLDLEGGLSVVLQAPAGTDKGVMEKALDRIRDRVDALGVAEPDISLVGGNLIQVQLPGLGGQGKVTKRGAQYCVTSSTGKSLGCFKDRAVAQAKAKAQSVQRVLQIVGQTARLEERAVSGTAIQPSDPNYSKTAFTTGVLQPDDPYRQNANFKEEPSKNGGLVTFEDKNDDGFFTPGTDPIYQLEGITITGADLKKAVPQFLTSQETQSSQAGWQVSFTLNGPGATKFAAATQKLVGRQLARQEVKTVSPLLGKESLHKGLIAGLAGLIALMLYLAFYYRLLGLVTWLGMGIWGVLAFGLVSLMGKTIGYALTLAGVAGIIVSLGITADSYIVFYERLKDEVRHGKTLRAAGSVRGFALTLGLSTGLDMFVVYFFKRPTVYLISRSPFLTSLRGMGLRSGVAADPLPVAGGER